MAKGSKEIFAEVEAQRAANARKNQEYFTRMDNAVKSNQAFINEMQVLKRRDDAVWKQFGINLDKCGDENPFLLLEKIAPDAFPGMSQWVERSRQDAIKELKMLGLDPEAGRRAREERNRITVSSKKSSYNEADIAKSRSKKYVRRVRL